MRSLTIIMRDPQKLKDRTNNPQTHSERQLRQITRSISEHGFYNPVIIDERDVLIAGHGRVEAARRLGHTSVPCIELEGLSEAQKRSLMLADNKIAANSITDRGKLAIIIDEILELDSNFDLSKTGYDAIEIDQLLIELEPEDGSGSPDDDMLLSLNEAEAVTSDGDVWLCGGHRVVCGNSLHRQVYSHLLGSETAQLVVTDPPFNVPIQGHAGGSGSIKHREFAMAAGEMSEQQFEAFLKGVFDLLVEFSADGSIHFVFMDWRHVGEIRSAGRQCYSELKNLIVWAKDNGGMGSFYRSRHELIFAFKNGTAPHINNFELGQFGRYRTNVWEYRGLNTGGVNRREELKMHPTAKPVRMLADAMLDCSRKGGIVLDPFGGAGSTMIAAEKTGRRARLIEIDPLYVDCTVRRWQECAKDDAIHAKTGETFNARAAGRKLAREIATIVWAPYPARPTVRRVDFSKAAPS